MTSQAECEASIKPHQQIDEGVFCKTVWDTLLCWPPTQAGEVVFLNCPSIIGFDKNKFAHRRCSPSGQWETKHGNVSEKGWTNFTTCFTKMGKKAEEIFFKGKTDEEIQTMKDIAEWIRHEEVFGLSLSMVTLTISLVIFFRFRSLNCHRTKIHRNLFFAILTQVIIRLTLYIDQYMGRALGGVSAGVQIGTTNTIHDTPVLCEVAVTILEYSSTVMFMWLFIEGLYLHNQITVSVFTSSPKFLLFYFIGWGFPFVPTIIWGLVVGFAYEEEMKNDRCWFGYEFMPVYWIIQGPRTAAIGINIIFLCNIIRVLVTKLKESRTSEVEQVRKAVKAAILLLPLLGTTNILSCVQAPVQTVVGFAVYSFIAHFMMSLQGFFVALLYCFMNGEVRKTLGRQWNHYRSRWRKGGRRQSRSLSFYTSETEVQMNGLLKTNGTKSKNQYKVKLGPITSNSMATETDAML